MADGTAPTEPEQQDPGSRDSSPRLLRWAMCAAALGLLVIYQSVDQRTVPVQPPTAVAGAAAPSAAAPSAAVPSAAAASPAAKAPAAPGNAVPPLARSKPTRIRIPQLAVEAPFTELGLDAAGTLEVPRPDDPNLVGWFRGGPTPGERGPALLAGHVDTAKGPAVFLMLRTLAPGSTVEITRADGTVAVFAVDAVKTFPKNGFPDNEVYADTPDAQLRLITCGGSYDRKLKDYTENIVVFAHLQSSRQA
ncbi:class F sortase [Saccharothrix sp. ST-888]|uniref:class F sortase n=1 Tax=Saccharothrix sp. ST-888 TaxID=1427391 RepID=UPI0005EC51BE|nr:class F sortase [Saccharothrix sp. ST-888]KJK55097.1 peptidase C60 [Saccharothrix sp. ST-888]